MVARLAASTSREQDAQTVHNMHCACSRQAANASVLNDQSWSWMPEPELVTITTTIRTICRYCTLNCITTPLLSATAADAAVCNNQLCIVVDKLLAGLLKCKIAARARLHPMNDANERPAHTLNTATMHLIASLHSHSRRPCVHIRLRMRQLQMPV